MALDILQAVKCPGGVFTGLRNEFQDVHVLGLDVERSVMYVCVCRAEE